MTPKQRKLARHALGLPNAKRQSFRNRFVASYCRAGTMISGARMVLATMRGVRTISAFHIRKLIKSYKQSAKWDRLAPRTKSDYSKVLEYILTSWVEKTLPRCAVQLSLRRKMQIATGRACQLSSHMLSILFEHAIDLDWQRDNPAKGIPKIKNRRGP